jgi:uncharacterized protein YerC
MVSLEAAFLNVQSRGEVTALLRTILTPGEIQQCRIRWKACQMSASQATQRAISKTLKISVATATRAAKATRENHRIVSVIAARKNGGERP